MQRIHSINQLCVGHWVLTGFARLIYPSEFTLEWELEVWCAFCDEFPGAFEYLLF